MQNYFNYFTEIEERFQQRRGSLLMLSTLDWALIETWREAGVPLEAVLRGIDSAFDKHDAKTLRAAGRVRRVNGLGWCAQSVMEAVEQTKEASIGAATGAGADAVESGFETERVGQYLDENAVVIEAAKLAAPADGVAAEVVARLRALALGMREEPVRSLEELDRTLTVLEEKLFASLLMAAPEEELVALREQAARELAPYRGKMQAVQIKQVQQQFLQKRLLEARRLPRLSLFYMSHG
jgi:anion-transporting  ArsA/GET3 family ATPase